MISTVVLVTFILSIIFFIPSPPTGDGAEVPPKIVVEINAYILFTNLSSKKDPNNVSPASIKIS